MESQQKQQMKSRDIRFSLKKNKHGILHKVKFLLIFFLILSACSRKEEPQLSSCLTREEKEDLDYFLRFLLIRHSGVFVLFGSKPLCDGGFFEHVVQRKKSPYLRNPLDGWKVWEKVKTKIPLNPRFVITMQPRILSIEGVDRKLYLFQLIDIQKTAIVLAENYELFKSCTGMDFHPLEKVFEIEDPNSIFWQKAFYDQVTLGILYGFGKNNALFYEWRENFEPRPGPISQFLQNTCTFACKDEIPWRDVDSKGFDVLSIPGFIAIEGDEVVERYKREKEAIRKIYRGKDLVETTLRRLAK